jgi:hypothetical protein
MSSLGASRIAMSCIYILPEKHGEALTPVSQNVTLFGNRVLADIIRLK